MAFKVMILDDMIQVASYFWDYAEDVFDKISDKVSTNALLISNFYPETEIINDYGMISAGLSCSGFRLFTENRKYIAITNADVTADMFSELIEKFLNLDQMSNSVIVIQQSEILKIVLDSFIRNTKLKSILVNMIESWIVDIDLGFSLKPGTNILDRLAKQNTSIAMSSNPDFISQVHEMGYDAGCDKSPDITRGKTTYERIYDAFFDAYNRKTTLASQLVEELMSHDNRRKLTHDGDFASLEEFKLKYNEIRDRLPEYVREMIDSAIKKLDANVPNITDAEEKMNYIRSIMGASDDAIYPESVKSRLRKYWPLIYFSLKDYCAIEDDLVISDYRDKYFIVGHREFDEFIKCISNNQYGKFTFDVLVDSDKGKFIFLKWQQEGNLDEIDWGDNMVRGFSEVLLAMSYWCTVIIKNSRENVILRKGIKINNSNLDDIPQIKDWTKGQFIALHQIQY